jgi:hypothetical protein
MDQALENDGTTYNSPPTASGIRPSPKLPSAISLVGITLPDMPENLGVGRQWHALNI